MQERDQAITLRRPLAAGSSPGLAVARYVQNSGAAARAGAAPVAGGQGDFGRVLAQAGARPVNVAGLAGGGSVVRTVVSGDTLTSLVKDHAESQGLQLSNSQAHRWVQQIAQDNKISNVNRIFPGQQITLGAIPADVAAQASGQVQVASAAPSVQSVQSDSIPTATALQSQAVTAQASAVQAVTTARSRPQPAARHEVLDRTLDRAVAKGFIPPNERGDVRNKILTLATEHRFNPDDFARMTLMESDGMNPRATNQRCHGIIQFCGGPDRGAASAGYGDNPKAILGLSVYQQLHLVDRYFDDVGLKNKGPAGLDDLYLSVLMPSARGETRADAPLNVSGPQARYLYEGRDSRAPMTRQSILQGLLQNAAERLGTAPKPPPEPPVKGRLQAMRTAAYDDALPASRIPAQLR